MTNQKTTPKRNPRLEFKIQLISITFLLGLAFVLSLFNERNVSLTSAYAAETPVFGMICAPKNMQDTLITNPLCDSVTVTFYNPTTAQTDVHPDNTATGFKIDVNNPYKHRVVAISRDLENMGYEMGDSIQLVFDPSSKAAHYSGNYVIEDRMPSYHTKKIDILVSSDMYMSKIRNVKLINLNP